MLKKLTAILTILFLGLIASSCTKQDDLFEDTGQDCFDTYDWEVCKTPNLEYGFQGTMNGVPICLGPGDGRGTYLNFARLTILQTKSSSFIFGNDSLGLDSNTFVQTYEGAFELLDSFGVVPAGTRSPEGWNAPFMYAWIPMPREAEFAHEYFKDRYPKGTNIPIRRDVRGEQFTETVVDGMNITLGTNCRGLAEIHSKSIIQPPDHFIRVADILDYEGENGEFGIVIELDMKVGIGFEKSPDQIERTLEGTFRFLLTE